MPSVVIIDHESGVHPAEIILVAQALQQQAIADFSAPPPYGWGTAATVRAATKDQPPRDTEWWLGLFRDPDQPGALGYHDLTPAGLPLMKVFPPLDAADGVPWSRTASHELCETLADPMLAMCFQSPLDGAIWAGEVCDAVEAFGYQLGTIEVSDFVLPAYFTLKTAPMNVKLDFLGKVTAPLQILTGGYGQTFTAANGWTMHDMGQRTARQLAATARSRTIRRRYPGQ